MDISAGPSLPFTILIFLVVITILVFVHEMGHFLTARFFKTKVSVFSIGFGKELFGWTDKHGTRWKVAPFPIGGYVKFEGDENAASLPSADMSHYSDAEKKTLFQYKPLYQRAAIVAAGPFINFLFAILIFAGFFMTVGQSYTEPLVTRIKEASPAFEAGFTPGDFVTQIDGQRIGAFEDIKSYVSVRPNVPIEITIRRAGAEQTIAVTPALRRERDRFGNEYEFGQLGLYGTKPAYVQRGPIDSFYYATMATYDQTLRMLDGLWQIVSGRISVDQLSGPVRIAKLSGEVASTGLDNLINFIAFVSISLGLINLFPIPMLDGGHLMFYLYEAVVRRPMSAKLQEAAMYAGFAFVVISSVFVTWNDLKALDVWKGLSQLVS